MSSPSSSADSSTHKRSRTRNYRPRNRVAMERNWLANLPPPTTRADKDRKERENPAAANGVGAEKKEDVNDGENEETKRDLVLGGDSKAAETKNGDTVEKSSETNAQDPATSNSSSAEQSAESTEQSTPVNPASPSTPISENDDENDEFEDESDEEDLPSIVAFYSGSSDRSGRTLASMLSYSDYALEARHDYIQHLFPLPERSPFNPNAPVIDASTTHYFRREPRLRDSLISALDRMLDFYGFVRTDSGEIKAAESAVFERKCRGWMCRFDHNHLRITRILRCLRVLGCEEEARKFHAALVEVCEERVEFRKPGERTMMFWRRAVARPLEVPPENERYENE